MNQKFHVIFSISVQLTTLAWTKLRRINTFKLSLVMKSRRVTSTAFLEYLSLKVNSDRRQKFLNGESPNRNLQITRGSQQSEHYLNMW